MPAPSGTFNRVRSSSSPYAGSRRARITISGFTVTTWALCPDASQASIQATVNARLMAWTRTPRMRDSSSPTEESESPTIRELMRQVF